MDRILLQKSFDSLALFLSWGLIAYIPLSFLISLIAGRNHTPLEHLLDRGAYYLIIAFALHLSARIVITLIGYLKKDPVPVWFKGVYSWATLIMFFDITYLFVQVASRF